MRSDLAVSFSEIDDSDDSADDSADGSKDGYSADDELLQTSRGELSKPDPIMCHS